MLIALHAAGVGVWDADVREGSWRPYGRPKFALVPGTDGAGVTLERCPDLVRAGGRLTHPNGVEPEPRRRRGVRVLAYDAVAGPAEFARLGRAVTEARLRVPIAAVYPLAQAARAHARLARGHILGRIVLRIRPA